MQAKRAVFFTTFFISVVPAIAQDHFVYDEHGKRDPFGPLVSAAGAVITYDSDMTVGDMSLEGVLADPAGGNLAIINGKVVKAGDLVGVYTIESISETEVGLSKDQERFTLKLKKGGT